MANRTDTFTTRLFINDEQAKNKLEELRKNIKQYQQDREEAAKIKDWEGVKKANDEIKQANKELLAMKTTSQKIDDVLNNLSGASVKELRQTISALNRELKSGAIERNSSDWKAMNDAIRQCKRELKGISDESKAASGTFGSFLEKFNRVGFALTNVLGIGGGISSLSDSVRQAVADFATMDEQMANTRKYTGMTAEAVREMNEDFKNMDTRTSREQLNDLAGAAGRLGISSKQGVEEFVDAADKINVALGDDLGDGAVDQVGKLAMAFGEDEKMGLRGAMLATGSAINELAQNSAANAGYLVDFTARVAGVGKQVGLSQAQIMGFAAVMDENMLQDEMASTAFSQMMTKMQTDTAKFAKFAGQDVKTFSNLVKTDFNGAILAIADNLKKQNPETMMKMLDDMGLDGTRAVSVLSNLADKIDDVRKMQDIATKAYKDGTSVIGEFNTMNNTTQAELDKAKKHFHELSIELGEQLRPATIGVISLSGRLLSLLSGVIGIVAKYKTSIISLVATIAVLRTILNLSNITLVLHYRALQVADAITKAYRATVTTLRAAVLAMRLVWIAATQGIGAYTAALNAAKAASMTNPWTALATVILTAAGAVVTLFTAISKHNEEAKAAAQATSQYVQQQKLNSDVTKDANSSVAESVTKLKALQRTLEDSNAKYEDRKKALSEIKKIVPEYHGTLTREGQLINNNVAVLQQYCDNLIKAARAQAAFNKMVQIQESSLNHEDLLKGRQRNQQWVLKQMAKYGYNPDEGDEYRYLVGDGTYVRDRYGNKKGKKLTSSQVQDLQHLQKIYNYNKKRQQEETSILATQAKQTAELQKQAELSRTGNSGGGNGGSGKNTTSGSTYQTDKERKAATTAATNAENKAKRERREAIQNETNDIKAHYDELQAENTVRYYTGEIQYSEYLKKQHELTVEGLQKQLDVYKKYGDNSKQLEADIAKEKYDQKQDEIKTQVAQYEREYKKEQMKIKADEYDPSSSLYHNEEAVQEQLFKLQIQYLKKKRDKQIEGSEEQKDIQAQIDELEEQHKLDLAQKYEEKVQKYREQWGKKDSKQQEDIALKGLDDLHSKGLIKETEYQEMLKQIKLHYAQEQSENNLYNSSGEEFKRNATSRYQTASNNAKAKYENDHPTGSGLSDYFTSDVTIFTSTIANLKSQEADFAAYHANLVKKNEETQEEANAAIEENHKETMAAMGQATADMCAGIAAKMQAAYDAVSPILDAMSSYYSAECDLEVTQTEKKYEKLIDNAGNNQAKQKKLEEKKEKEIAKIKTKYNRKQVKMQIAQAIATSAIGALNAYASVLAGAPWPANQILAPIAAGLALAAGAIQIATIKKQAQAQEAGYYEGGFTGGRSYRREAGVVHEGEFVANHQAVNNPQLMPAFRLLDMAQRNNTVGSLTATDVSRSMGVGGSATVINNTPAVVVNNDNSDIAGTLQHASDTINSLGELLASGQIIVKMPDWDEFDRSRKHWDNIKSNR